MRFARWLAVMLLLLALAGDARACPNCKEALASQNGDSARLSQGFNYSVLFMIAMPATIFGTGAFAVARAVKRGALPPF